MGTERIFAPLNRKDGYSASEAIRRIQEVVVREIQHAQE
jgi:hypothetical protein